MLVTFKRNGRGSGRIVFCQQSGRWQWQYRGIRCVCKADDGTNNGFQLYLRNLTRAQAQPRRIRSQIDDGRFKADLGWTGIKNEIDSSVQGREHVLGGGGRKSA